MLDQDRRRTSTLRLINAAIKDRDIAARGAGKDPVSRDEILEILIPHITIPVRTGRDLARLVEVAALDQKLKSMGQNSAVEFNQRLLNLMQKKKDK